LGGQQETRVGEAVRADFVIAGGFQRAGAMLRITPRVLDIASGEVLAGGKIDGRWDDLFALQDRVVAEILDALPVMREAKPMAAPQPPGVQAYEQYALGRKKMLILRKDSLEEAQQHFENAIRLDPGYAAAHSGLGCVHAFLFIRLTNPQELMHATQTRVRRGITGVEPDGIFEVL